MNRKDAREMALDMVGLPDNRAIGGRDPVRLANTALAMAHREVQVLAMELDNNLFIKRSRFTYPANELRVNLDTYLDTASSGQILKIWRVSVLRQNADISRSNPPWLLDPFTELGVYRGGVSYNLSGFSGPTGASVAVTGTLGIPGKMGWTLVNNDLELRPIPTSDYWLYVEWVPVQLFDSDEDLVLGGLVPQAEMLVVYKSAEIFARLTGRNEVMLVAAQAFGQGQKQLQEQLMRRPPDHGHMNLDPQERY